MGSYRALRIVLAGLILILPTEGVAQQLSISGTVRDADGVVGDTTVTLFVGGAEPRMATTDASGNYNFADLTPGYYELSFARAGFDTVTRNLTLLADPGSVDVTLAVGSISTSVTVTDVAGKATASRLEIQDRDLPVQITSIPQQLLQQQGINDVATALRNVSGVQSQRLYGVYEQYTIRGFNAADVMLVDGMRTEAILNRQNTQVNNVERVEVLKGPSSVLYGGDAVGGAINIIRKKPQGTPAYDFLYKVGRFNTHQVAGGATGPLAGYSLLYRVDASQDYSEGWRGAGANRTNVSPSLTWLINEGSRVTAYQTFNRDNFKGDGGVPVELISTRFFDPSRRFDHPDSFALIEDSQTHILFNTRLAPRWEFRDGFLMRRTSEEYFVTEFVAYDPDANSVERGALQFHHHRRPYVNQAELVGHVNLGKTRHTLLFGYDYRHFFTRTDTTAGGGDFPLTPISLSDFRETNPPITTFRNIVRGRYTTNRIHAAFVQDQIDLGPKVKINVGGRFDDYNRDRYDIFVNNPGTRTNLQARSQTASTYRVGIVVAPVENHQVYFSSNSAFTPVVSVPPNGAELKPQHGFGYEGGYRWQGLEGRIEASAAAYYIEQNNLSFNQSLTTVIQAGKQTSKGVDVDINADLGSRTRLILNYGYTNPEFKEFDSDGDDLSGNRPRFAQKQAANAWLNKSWASGFNASIGARYVGPMFTNNENTIRIAGWTTVAGAVGYRRNFWELSVNAENLFDRERYFTPSDYSDQVYPGQPINVFTTLRFKFQ